MPDLVAANPLDARTIAAERMAVVRAAREWAGTPFHHRAAIKGVGADCMQFLHAVFASVGVIDPIDVRPYSADWFLHQDGERIIDAIRPFVVERDLARETPESGDIALFRYGRAASHGGLLAHVAPRSPHLTTRERLPFGTTLLHAFRGRGVVEEPCWDASAMGQRLDSVWTLRRWVEEGRACPA